PRLSTPSLHDALPILQTVSLFRNHTASHFGKTAVIVSINTVTIVNPDLAAMFVIPAENLCNTRVISPSSFVNRMKQGSFFLNAQDRKSTRLNSSHVKN